MCRYLIIHGFRLVMTYTTAVAFVDLGSAFDMLPHSTLISRLNTSFGVSGTALRVRLSRSVAYTLLRHRDFQQIGGWVPAVAAVSKYPWLLEGNFEFWGNSP
jgi:hypothetical protein